MPSELSQKEFLETWRANCAFVELRQRGGEDCSNCPQQKNCKQAYEQIKSILSQKEVSEEEMEEFVRKHSIHMSVNTHYDEDDQKQGKTDFSDYPRVRNALKKAFKEYEAMRRRKQ